MDDLLDVHPALRRGDHAHTLGLAVEHDAEIKLALERFGDFHIDPLDDLSFRTRLLRDEMPAEECRRGFVHVVIGLAQLDAARLAARTGVNLRLHGPVPAAEFGGAVDGLVGRVGHRAALDWHAEPGQQFLRLIFVDVHVGSLDECGVAGIGVTDWLLASRLR